MKYRKEFLRDLNNKLRELVIEPLRHQSLWVDDQDEADCSFELVTSEDLICFIGSSLEGL